ncbi:hypothetical protein C5167_002465 [Papaver somniferum]|uniref:Uncharacterized protein n=1 Tax=Papaver somniferum TaxID=3469 RepID=A0A4Y7L0P5_PAPSO|nr:hypothetical protein C5167_002465 [Papaver somniferum]
MKISPIFLLPEHILIGSNKQLAFAIKYKLLVSLLVEVVKEKARERWDETETSDGNRERQVSLEWLLALGPSLGIARVPSIGLVYADLTSGIPANFSRFVTSLPAFH